MCMLSLQFTQTVGRFRCTRKPEMLRLRSQNFACETINFACEAGNFACETDNFACEIHQVPHKLLKSLLDFSVRAIRGGTPHFVSPFSPSVVRSAPGAQPKFSFSELIDIINSIPGKAKRRVGSGASNCITTGESRNLRMCAVPRNRSSNSPPPATASRSPALESPPHPRKY
jgi:hypothetical protein